MYIETIFLMLKHKINSFGGKSISVIYTLLTYSHIPASLSNAMVLIQTFPSANCVTLGKTSSQFAFPSNAENNNTPCRVLYHSTQQKVSTCCL